MLIGGIIGGGIDVATGATLSHTPNPLVVTLVPKPVPPPPVTVPVAPPPPPVENAPGKDSEPKKTS